VLGVGASEVTSDDACVGGEVVAVKCEMDGAATAVDEQVPREALLVVADDGVSGAVSCLRWNFEAEDAVDRGERADGLIVSVVGRGVGVQLCLGAGSEDGRETSGHVEPPHDAHAGATPGRRLCPGESRRDQEDSNADS
jgi:hypothetical protein